MTPYSSLDIKVNLERILIITPNDILQHFRTLQKLLNSFWIYRQHLDINVNKEGLPEITPEDVLQLLVKKFI